MMSPELFLIENVLILSNRNDKNEHDDASAFSYEESLRMAEEARLMLVRGIGARWALTLQRAGIETVEKLSEMTPEVVRMKLDLLSAKPEKTVSRLPSKMTIADWIVDASRLRRKSQPVGVGRRPSSVLRFISWMGLDPELFQPYVRIDSLEHQTALSNARLRYGYKVIIRILFFLILILHFTAWGYLVISRAMMANRFMDFPDIMRFVLTVAAGGLAPAFFLLGSCSMLLLWVHVCFSAILAMKQFTDRAVSKLTYRENNDVRFFAARWSEAIRALEGGAFRLVFGIVVVAMFATNMFFLATLDSDSITLDHVIIPLSIAMVLAAGLIGAKASASDSALLRWTIKHPRSSSMFFGSNVDNVRRWHALVIMGRGIDAMRAFCCLALGIGLLLVGAIVITILINQLFAPAIKMWVELVGLGTSERHSFRTEIPELLTFLVRTETIWVVFAAWAIFSFFYIGVPYLINRGRRFLLSFIIALSIGLIFDFTIGGIRSAFVGMGRVYYVLTAFCVYVLFKRGLQND